MIIPLSNIVHNENVNYTKYNGQISDKSANNMPNGLLRVSEIQNGKNLRNFTGNRDNIKQIYNSKLSPSAGSLTENFLKARSLSGPIYMHNEAITKYESISIAPLKPKQMKKTLNMIL